MVRLHNNAATAGTFEGLDSAGQTITVVLGPNETYTVETPVRSIDASECDDNISAVCYYWPCGMVERNS
jgi:hypothetical protein